MESGGLQMSDRGPSSGWDVSMHSLNWKVKQESVQERRSERPRKRRGQSQEDPGEKCRWNTAVSSLWLAIRLVLRAGLDCDDLNGT